ncbi:DUF3944 domain-containing protein [Helicobacter pylori]
MEFLNHLSSNDLKDLFDALVYDEDGEKRFTEGLTLSEEYKRHGNDYAKYAERIAEELQRYGANSFASVLRGTRVLYREILCEVCNKLKVNYNKKSDTTLIEENMLSSILQKSLEKMSDEEIRELCDELGVKNTNKLGKQALSTATLTLFRMDGFKSYQLALIVANAVIKAIFQRGLSLGANAALTRGLSILAGPIGWVITGVWTAIGIAGPAYRVTVPACVLVATLRLKLKAEQEARLKAEQAKQAEREADKKKMWYLVIVFCILIGLAVLAVFYMKGKHHSSNNPKNGVEKLKNPSHKD